MLRSAASIFTSYVCTLVMNNVLTYLFPIMRSMVFRATTVSVFQGPRVG